MKTAVLLLAAFAPAFAQQGFDFKSLDKLAAKAKESTNITLEGDTLKMAGNFLQGQDKAVQDLVKGLRGVFVRSFTFKEKGQYDMADLASFRNYLKSSNWNKIVDVREENETSEIYLQTKSSSTVGGLAIVSAEPKELTLVYISGDINLSDLGKLGGTLGIPNMSVQHGATAKKDDQKKD